MPPSNETGLRFGDLGPHCLHLSVDMQRLFAEPTEWETPWMRTILPAVVRIAAAHPDATIFTRFVPAKHPGDGEGTWRRYYRRWSSMTLDRLDPEMVELLPDLAAYIPPAEVVDKHVYSPWVETDLADRLVARDIDTLVITGGETDVCVLGTVLGAVDRGYRVVIAADAVCSSSDETYDAFMALFHKRFGQQVETAWSDEILERWTPPGEGR
mgnify:CR=1 FL=1